MSEEFIVEKRQRSPYTLNVRQRRARIKKKRTLVKCISVRENTDTKHLSLLNNRPFTSSDILRS